MGIKSNRTIASYFNRFGATGLDAVGPVPVPAYTEATGGIISDYTDPGPGKFYRAHIFTSSGTFVVSQVGDGAGGGPSDVEYLVVAGGGGGGNRNGGGGGAGGYRSSVTGENTGGGGSLETALTVTSSPGSNSYTVTIGGGGYGGPNIYRGGDAGSNSDSSAETVRSIHASHLAITQLCIVLSDHSEQLI